MELRIQKREEGEEPSFFVEGYASTFSPYVLMTVDDIDYSERIERLSEYIASTGKSYKSHLATIRSWARKDGAKASTMPSYGGEENWSL